MADFIHATFGQSVQPKREPWIVALQIPSSTLHKTVRRVWGASHFHGAAPGGLTRSPAMISEYSLIEPDPGIREIINTEIYGDEAKHGE